VHAAGQSTSVGSSDASHVKGPPAEVVIEDSEEGSDVEVIDVEPEAGPSKSSFGTRQPTPRPRATIDPHPHVLCRMDTQ
jgi:hypothetical protein